PPPLSRLSPMLLPLRRQACEKRLVKRSAVSLWRAAGVSRIPRREPAVDAAVDDLGGGVVFGLGVHCLRLVLRTRYLRMYIRFSGSFSQLGYLRECVTLVCGRHVGRLRSIEDSAR